jgi:hypothetical protein
LALAGVRGGRPDWVEAGARAQAYAIERALDRSSVFESMLVASGYNLLRLRAPATPTFAARRGLWEDYLRTIEPVTDARVDACPRTSTWSRPSRTSSSPAAGCAQ